MLGIGELSLYMHSKAAFYAAADLPPPLLACRTTDSFASDGQVRTKGRTKTYYGVCGLETSRVQP